MVLDDDLDDLEDDVSKDADYVPPGSSKRKRPLAKKRGTGRSNNMLF